VAAIFCAPGLGGGLEWWWPSLGAGAPLLLAITCGALYPACQWAACQGQMARKGVSCIVSTPGDGCVAGGLTSLSRPWITAWPRPTAVSVAPYMGSVVAARERVSHRVFFYNPVPGSPAPGCGYGGVDQIWPSEIPARFSGHSSLPGQPEPPGQGWIQVCVKEPDTFTCKLASVSSPLSSSSSSYLWPGRIFLGCLRLGLGPADLA